MAQDFSREQRGKAARRLFVLIAGFCEEPLLRRLTALLRGMGIHSKIANDSEEAIALAHRLPFPVVLLRWPTESPVHDPVPGLRRLSWWVPILMLAESDEPEARREALESGADFLLRFPGAERELLAILESLGNRYARNPPEESRGLRPPILDRKKRIVRWRDQAVSFTPAELTIADYLFQHAGRVVMAEELAAQLYRRHPGRPPSPLSLHTHLSNLRRKLSRLSTEILLRSVCGKGFLLEWGPGRAPQG